MFALTAVACSSGSGARPDGGAGSGGRGGIGGIFVMTGLAGQDGGGGTAGGGTGGTVIDAGSVCSGDAAGEGGTADSDLDGVADCNDGCPLDALKQAPGMCGCGVADVDSDGDGTLDCKEMCPNDPLKLMPGLCGCGRPDTGDTDGDGTIDCLDGCPKDRTKTTAGPCGCLPDTLGALCLAHRYSFDGAAGTTVATDSVGGPTANGTVVNATLTGNGTLVLAGGTSDQYVKLPAGLVSTMGNSATFEAWVTWAGVGGTWQRIFDFGSSDMGADLQGGVGASYLFLTPRAGNGNFFRVAISLTDFSGEDLIDGVDRLPAAFATHVAVVIDGATNTMRLYQNGRIQPPGTTGLMIRPSTTLSAINDTNNWLGRSQYMADPEFNGTFLEFRIYSRALTAAQLSTNAALGPDVLPPAALPPPPPPPPDAGGVPEAGAPGDGPVDVAPQ